VFLTGLFWLWNIGWLVVKVRIDVTLLDHAGRDCTCLLYVRVCVLTSFLLPSVLTPHAFFFSSLLSSVFFFFFLEALGFEQGLMFARQVFLTLEPLSALFCDGFSLR
jgi:hypothetical protein